MRLKKLTARNFQRHKKKVLRFDPHITTIVGRSDRGKSSLVRALRFVCLNQVPKNFIRKGATESTVTLVTTDGTVSRTKGRRSNLYQAQKQTYKAFGQGGPPSAVKNLLKLEEANFQRQHDAPFWFSESPGNVSRKLNEIVDLNVIDRVQKLASAETRQTKSAVTATQLRLSEARATKKTLAWVPRLSADFKELQLLVEQQQATQAHVDQLTRLLQDARRLEELEDMLTRAARDAKKLVKAAEPIATLNTAIYDLGGTLEELTQLESDVCQQQKEKRRRQQALDNQLQGTCPVCQAPLKS